jgi:D-alanyl-D-alanine carboxypeptidase (penicillin-binding protein 5/6)
LAFTNGAQTVILSSEYAKGAIGVLKRISVFLITVILALTAFLGTAQAAAPQYDGDVGPFAVMLVDASSGAVLYEKNADETIEPASTTKIMTLLIALENADMDSVVTVSSNAANQGGSLLHISTGEKIVMKDLLNGMMMVSGNDAAVAVAEAVGGSEEGFAEMMNTKASELGMTNTHFVVPHGMHVDNHYSTARDMAILAEYAMQNQAFAQIVGQVSYTMPSDNTHSSTWEAKNTNKLLLPDNQYYYKNATGIKTGSTPNAGDCLISSASKDGMNLICLVFKDEYNGSERWPLSKSLFEFGFKNFRTLDMQPIFDSAEPVSVPVENAADGTDALSLKVANAGGEYQTFEKALADKVEAGGLTSKITLANGGDSLSAPISEGDEVGTIDYLDDANNVVYQGKLVASASVADAEAETEQPSTQTSDQTQPTATQTQTTPGTQDGIGLLGWILIGIGAVLLVILIIFAVLIVRRKRRRYARRRAIRRKRR